MAEAESAYQTAFLDAAVVNALAGKPNEPLWQQVYTLLIRRVRTAVRLADAGDADLHRITTLANAPDKLEGLLDVVRSRLPGSDSEESRLDAEAVCRWYGQDWLRLDDVLRRKLVAGLVVVSVQDVTEGDSATLPETLTQVAEQVEAVQPEGPEVAEVVADKGYHSDKTLAALDELEVRSYISEPERGPRRWQDKRTGKTPPAKRAAQQALYGNRRRTRGDRGRRLQRRRGELVERPFAHQYETGGLRRVWVRGHENVRKRVLIQAACCNLGLLLRRLTGVGTPRSLQGRALSAIRGLIGHLIGHWGRLEGVWGPEWRPAAFVTSFAHRQAA